MKIKKILCSLIIGFGLLSFSNAGYVRQVGVYGYSPYQNDYNLNVNIKGTLMSEFLGNTKNVLYFSDSSDNKVFFFFTNDGKPYFYNYQKACDRQYGYCANLNTQGVPISYYLCDSFDSNFSGTPVNCSSYNVDDSTDLVYKNFFSSITRDDYYYFDIVNRVGSWKDQTVGSTLCFSSSSLGKSLCFGQERNSGYVNGSPFNIGVIDIFSFENTITFSTLNSSFLGQSPGISGGNGNTNTQTNQLTCPTIQQLINNFEPQYNTGLCYSNKLIYSGGQFQQVTPKTIFELYPQYQDFVNDINTYYNYCKPPSTQETCGNAFTGKIEEWTLISKLPENVTPVNVYNYCNYTLNLNPNQTICTISTGNLNPGGITVEDNIDNINRLPITVVTPGKPPQEEGNGTGSVFDKYTQQEDETKRRDIIGKAENTIETMKEIYTKLSGIFRARDGKEGIIPPLITGIIALILLYKLWKK